MHVVDKKSEADRNRCTSREMTMKKEIEFKEEFLDAAKDSCWDETLELRMIAGVRF